MPRKRTLQELQYSLDRNERQVAKWSNRIHALDDKIRADEKMEAMLTRKARTNRLCTRAGMLEGFLREPEALTNDQVMDLLRIAFRQEAVQAALQAMLDEVGSDSDRTNGTA